MARYEDWLTSVYSFPETVPDTLACLTGTLNEQRDLSRGEELKAGLADGL
jgi:hypothetical protein